MPPSLIIRTQVLLIVGLALLGCAHDRACRVCNVPAGRPAAMAEELPAADTTADRRSLTPELTRLPDTATVKAALQLESQPAQSAFTAGDHNPSSPCSNASGCSTLLGQAL